MKHMKQFFAILLTIALTVCLLPAEAMATEVLKAEDMADGALTEGVVPEEKTMIWAISC